MAGFRRNIDKQIQIGLDARVAAHSNFNGSSIRSDLLAPVQASDDFTLTRDDQMLKTPFIRMIAPGQTRTDILYGSFNDEGVPGAKIGSIGAGDEDFFKSVGVGTADQEYFGNRNMEEVSLRPIPGISQATIDFIQYGGSVRKATVVWKCYTIDQLEHFQKGSFLSSGQYVILDWGWARGDRIPKLLMKSKDGQIKLDERLFKVSTTKNGTAVSKASDSAWDKLYKNYYGDWSGLIGVISKFTWAQGEDGAFECQTEILARGSNIFADPIEDTKNENTYGPINSVYSFEDVVEELIKGVAPEKITSELNSSPQLNIAERVKVLDLEIVSKYFGSRLEGISEPTVLTSDDSCICAILAPSTEGVTGVQLTTDGLEEGEISRAQDFSSNIWVKWGWLEDNFVSYYCPYMDPNSGRRVSEFRSVDSSFEGIGPPLLQQTKIKNDKYFYTVDPSLYILPGQFPEDWHPINAKDEKANVWRKLAQEVNRTFEPFAVDDNYRMGYLRNVMVNLSAVQDAFVSGKSIQAAMLQLANNLNSPFEFYSFEISEQENLTTANTTYGIKEAEGESDEGQQDRNLADPSESYVFENYGENSLVKSLSLSATIPDKFAISAGFGSIRDESNTDPISLYISNRTGGKTASKKAESLGKFFSDPENANKLSIVQSLGSGNVYNNKFGNPGVGSEIDGIIELDSDGLRGPWNHSVSKEILQVAGTADVNYMEQFEERYKDSMSKNAFKLSINRESGTIDGTVKNMFGTLIEGDAELLDDLKKPYNLSGKMRPQMKRPLTWYLTESPLTNLITKTPKAVTLPLQLDMTIEGCSGLFPGNMFRLSYLPKIYGQTESIPKTFFHIQSLQHQINSEGWITGITGLLNKNNELERLKEQEEFEKLGIDLEEERQKLVQAFEEQIQIIIDGGMV